MSDASQWLMVKNLIFIIDLFISDDSAVSQRGRQTARARLDHLIMNTIGSDRIGSDSLIRKAQTALRRRGCRVRRV